MHYHTPRVTEIRYMQEILFAEIGTTVYFLMDVFHLKGKLNASVTACSFLFENQFLGRKLLV